MMKILAHTAKRFRFDRSPLSWNAHPLALFLMALSLGPSNRILAVDWPQYRGPNLNGISTETIRTNWTAEPPKEVWKAPIGSA